MAGDNALFQFLLRQGDNSLVLGHRLSEWCGMGPALEEDIALANTALDLIGQTRLWLSYAAEVEGAGRSEDDLAYLRDAYDFRNALLLEVPNEDFGRTILREFFFDAFQLPWLHALIESADERVAEIAAKSAKEASYHLERSAETVIALGDSTDESNAKLTAALAYLWPFAGELMVDDEVDHAMAEAGVAPLPSTIKPAWNATVNATFKDALLTRPDSDFAHAGGRNGFRHTEHLGHMLAQMQVLQRSHPGATW
ncbi:MAG: 1,2-phenylacetyl-CoA epoxidase subunit PaaC [Pseudomonadota bacterium]